MTIDEAIEHAREASEREDLCDGCREEHQQLAEWLEELKDYRDKNKLCIRIDVENLGSLKDKCFEIAKEYYNKAIDDFANNVLTEIKYGVGGNIEDFIKEIAEQLKAGGENAEADD